MLINVLWLLEIVTLKKQFARIRCISVAAFAFLLRFIANAIICDWAIKLLSCCLCSDLGVFDRVGIVDGG